MNKRIAAIDIGTNSFHIIVVELNDNGNFDIIDRAKEVIRLSEGSTDDIKIIKEESIERAIAALKNFGGIAKSHNAEIKAVATSAVREASNKIDFLKKVNRETGITINVISGVEEGRLIYLGVLKSVPIYNKRVLCIDIGGGSTEFVVGFKGKILYANSLKLGAVRLTKKFFANDNLSEQKIIDCIKWIEGEVFPIAKLLKHFKIDMVVGSSGTIMAAGLMIKSLEESIPSYTILNNYTFGYSDLQIVKEKILNAKTSLGRKKIKGLDEKRADIIPAGILLLSTILENLKLDKMIISGYALREGIIYDYISKELQTNEDHFKNDIRSESAEQLAKSCNFDYKHCLHVANLAEILFDQLIELHKLPSYYKEYLIIAAKLHDIGYHIAHSKHHKHSQYIIVNSELLGFNENEIRTIACVARYHRKSHPKISHEEFMLLPKEWRVVVKLLSAILRIVDAFDRTHNSLVNYLEVNIETNKIILSVENNLKDIEIELWSINRRKQLFEEVFGKKIVVKSFT